MPNTRDIRNRIKAVKNTAKITRAMQLVAASKMKRAQDTALQGRPYASLMARMLGVLNDRLPELNHPFLEDREVKMRGVLIISTDRGLCGSLNANLFREAASLDKGRRASTPSGRRRANSSAGPGASSWPTSPSVRGLPSRSSGRLSRSWLRTFKAGKIDSIEVLYSRFKNTLIQEPRLTPFLPLDNFTAAFEKSLAAEGQGARRGRT
jgi:F-type H+-transporting ATPase subunit gamma